MTDFEVVLGPFVDAAQNINLLKVINANKSVVSATGEDHAF